MSGNTLNRIFLARLAGTAVFDPNGDPVGKVRDAVATLRTNNAQPRILGLVVEVPMRRRVFVPITRVTSIESGTVIITGLVNMRRFEVRTGEVLVLGDMLDRLITLVESDENVVVEDMAMEQNRNGDWLINKVHIMRKSRGLRRKGPTSTVAWEEVTGFASVEPNQGVTNLLYTLSTLRPADLATVLQDLPPKRRVEVARALEHPRAFEVVSGMIKNVSDVNDRLMDLHKKKKEFEKKDIFEAIKDFVDECIESFINEDSVTYSVAKDNKVIALAFLHNLSEHPNWAEVGIMINKDYHKKKIGTSVIKKLIETSSYDNFYAVINPNNIGSRKLFEKLGFIYDPNLKREGYISYIYRKTPK